MTRSFPYPQDDVLRDAVYGNDEGKDNWNNVAVLVGRTAVECEERWHKVVQPRLAGKGPWTPEVGPHR